MLLSSDEAERSATILLRLSIRFRLKRDHSEKCLGMPTSPNKDTKQHHEDDQVKCILKGRVSIRKW